MRDKKIDNPEINAELIKAHNLTQDEYQKILEIMDRQPTLKIGRAHV